MNNLNFNTVLTSQKYIDFLKLAAENEKDFEVSDKVSLSDFNSNNFFFSNVKISMNVVNFQTLIIGVIMGKIVIKIMIFLLL